MQLRELDLLETSGHTFYKINMESHSDFWVCEWAVDGEKREAWLEPKANVDGLTSDEFENYIHAQALGRPPARS